MINKIIKVVQDYPFLSFSLTLLFILLFQSLNIFWGFELLDSGYHLTAFDNVFDAPNSVSGNFCYYLTNMIGGMIMNLFPGIGVVGFRIVGALFVDISILLIFLCLRKEIPTIYLLIGSILVVMNYIQIPYSFNNGICSCFFYVCALLALYKGLVNEKKILVILSGILVGINIFSRIPNVLAIGLVFIATFHSYIESNQLYCDRVSALLFLFGVMTGIIVVMILFFSLGHQDIIKETLYLLFLQGTSSGDGHSFGNLIWTQIYFYLNAIIFAALFFSIISVYRYCENRLLKVLFVGLASFVIFYHVYLNFGYEPLWAVCAVGCCLCLNKRGHQALLASLAFYMLIVEILGSSGGNNHGSLPALLAAPVASYTLLNRRNVIFVAVACIALFMKVIKQGNYFDFGPLSLKNSSIKVEECSLIKTTAERAEAMNATLPDLRRYVHPEDTLLVYNAAPMMNYLTHTRPAGGASWPALGYIKPLVGTPKILVQKSDGFTISTQSICVLPTGNQMIDSYMQDLQYKIVWENPYFILLFPQK